MLKVHRTPDELVRIYTLKKEGLNGFQIAEQLGVKYDSVLFALRRLDHYISGKVPRDAGHSTSYQTAARLIRKQRSASRLQATTPPEAPTPPTEQPSSDHFDALKSSFEVFQQAVAVFIDAELKRRYRALQGEIQVLREENEHLKTRQQTNINWLDQLKDYPKEEA